MLFKWFARGLLVVAYVAVCIYAVTAETGPIGWFNYAQQSLFGSYSQKLTMLAAIVVSLLVLGPLWLGIEALGRRHGIADALPPVVEAGPPAQAPSKRGFLLSSLVAIPLIWLGGYATWWYFQYQHHEDATATYEPVQLRRNQTPAPASAYLSIDGRLLWERTVTLTKGASKSIEYTLVPLVAEGWRDGEPVPYVVRVDDGNRYLAERATRAREAILARTDGAVAVPAAQEFRKMEVPTSDATRLLRLVPSERGAPALRDSAESDWQVYLWLAGGGSVFYLLMMGVIALAIANAERKQRKQQSLRRR